MAALAHHVPGKWVGHAVLSATFRHPSVLAKAATVHGPRDRRAASSWASAPAGSSPSTRRSGSRSPPMPERFDRFESAVHVIRALFSDAAATEAGRHPAGPVLPARRRDQRPAAADARRPADLARRPEAPRHRARRGGRRRAGCCRPCSPTRRRRTWPTSASGATRSSRAMAAIGRDPAGFAIVAQVPAGTTAETRRAGARRGPRRRRPRRDPRHRRHAPRLGPAGGRRGRRRGRRAAPRGARVTLGDPRPAAGDADLATYRRDRQRRQPRGPDLGRGAALERRDLPGRRRASSPTLDGGRSGRRRVGRIYVYPPEFPYLWGTLDVLARCPPAGRRHARSWPRISARAAAAGKIGLHIPASDARPDGIEFLAIAGSTELERIEGAPPRPRRARRRPTVDAPAGVDAHDARRAARTSSPASTPSRSRPSPTSPAATSRWPSATSPSSAPATSIATRHPGRGVLRRARRRRPGTSSATRA